MWTLNYDNLLEVQFEGCDHDVSIDQGVLWEEHTPVQNLQAQYT